MCNFCFILKNDFYQQIQVKSLYVIKYDYYSMFSMEYDDVGIRIHNFNLFLKIDPLKGMEKCHTDI